MITHTLSPDNITRTSYVAQTIQNNGLCSRGRTTYYHVRYSWLCNITI